MTALCLKGYFVLSLVGEELNCQGMTQNFMKNQLYFKIWAVKQMLFLSGKEKGE